MYYYSAQGCFAHDINTYISDWTKKLKTKKRCLRKKITPKKRNEEQLIFRKNNKNIEKTKRTKQATKFKNTRKRIRDWLTMI